MISVRISLASGSHQNSRFQTKPFLGEMLKNWFTKEKQTNSLSVKLEIRPWTYEHIQKDGR